MKKTIFMDKYPVWSLEIAKDKTDYKNVDEIISYLETLVQKHKVATFIAIFDHYIHTQGIDGEINDDIKDAKNIIFCFGKAIPNTKVLAARPRSIGVCEMQDSFMIDFMEAPNEQLTIVMQDWVKSILKD